MFETKTAATKPRLIGMPIPTGCRGSRTRGRRPRPSPRRCPSRHPLRPSRIVSRRMRRRGERRRRRRASTHRSARARCAPLPREAGRRRLRRSSLLPNPPRIPMSLVGTVTQQTGVLREAETTAREIPSRTLRARYCLAIATRRSSSGSIW
jgi:hypothetical protein